MTRLQWCGFLALCLLSASVWLVDSAWPSLLPSAQRRALHEGLIALAVGGVGWKSAAWKTLRSRRWAKLALASIGLLGLPATLVDVAGARVSEVAAAALFALLPVAVVVLVANFDSLRGADAGTGQLLAPALVGLAGTLLLLSFALPQSPRQAGLQAVVVAAVVMTAVASVCMYRLLAEFTLVEAAVISCVANAVFAFAAVLLMQLIVRGAAAWVPLTWSTFATDAVTSLVFDLPQMLLLLWLMRAVAPVRLAARSLVIPLLTVAEGYALLRPAVTTRSLCGAALLIAGAWRLMTVRPREEEPTLVLHR